jgi:hypothetical protein
VTQCGSRSSNALCVIFSRRPNPRKTSRVKKYRSNTNCLLKNQCAIAPLRFQNGSRRRSRISEIKSFNVEHTLPELRGRRDRTQDISTTRRLTESSTSWWCDVYVVRIRLSQWSCFASRLSGYGIAVTAASGVDNAAAEVLAAEGAAAEAEAEARPEPPAKSAPRPRPSPAPAPPSEPTPRQKTMEQAKEKEIYRALKDSVKKLSEQLKQPEREKQQLEEAQKAKSG